jgi:preprotein translocase subunit YajC
VEVTLSHLGFLAFFNHQVNKMNYFLFFQGGQQDGFGLLGFAPIILILLIFYFLVLRPQKKQQQKLQEMIANLQINDEVVTSGGIICRIKEIRETSFVVVSGEKTFLEIGKSAVIGKKEGV